MRSAPDIVSNVAKETLISATLGLWRAAGQFSSHAATTSIVIVSIAPQMTTRLCP